MKQTFVIAILCLSFAFLCQADWGRRDWNQRQSEHNPEHRGWHGRDWHRGWHGHGCGHHERHWRTTVKPEEPHFNNGEGDFNPDKRVPDHVGGQTTPKERDTEPLYDIDVRVNDLEDNLPMRKQPKH